MSAFLEKCRYTMRAHNLAYKTAKSYLPWIKRYILFHNKQHPSELGEEAVNAFISHLAAGCGCAVSTQSQALCALVFMYRHVLEQPLGDIGAFALAKRPRSVG